MAQTFILSYLILYLIGTTIVMALNTDKLLDQNTPLNMPLRGIYKK